MPLSPDDPFLMRVIDLGNNAISRIQAGAQRRLLEIYQLERDALMQRISRSRSQETFGARHRAVIVKALREAIRRLETSLGQVQEKAVEEGAEAGAEDGIHEIGRLEGRFGEASIARSLASLVAVVPHRAIADVAALAQLETKNLTIEMDQTVRGFVQRALIQGRSSEQIVPELAKAIGDGLDQKRWQLERTLRTGLNAATNRGHNAGYLEAREILPDLKRQAHEFLQAAQKIRGRGRVNHPFSFVVHGKVTELDAPWVVPSKEFPVMFWGRDSGQSAYIGMHYPAHLYDRGRQVPFRERWEAGAGKMMPVARQGPNIAESREPKEDWVTPPFMPDDREQKTIWDRALDRTGLRNFANEEGIRFKFVKAIIEEIEDPATRKMVRIGNTARYDPEARLILVSVSRPKAPTGKFEWGESPMVSEGAGSWAEAFEQAIVHELAHAKLSTLSGLDAVEEGKKPFEAAQARGRAASRRALDDPQEYLAETSVAFVYHRRALEKFDKAGYNVVRNLLEGDDAGSRARPYRDHGDLG